MAVKKPKGSFINSLATFIVDKRKLIFLIYAVAAVFCVVAMSWTKVENDITTYLPESSETRQGFVAMSDNFEMPGMASIMVRNISPDTADELYEKISDTEGVLMVSFGEGEEGYKDSSALYSVTFEGTASSETATEALGEIRSQLKDYDLYVDSSVGANEIAMLEDEMTTILIVAVVIILVVLTLTSRAYAEVPVLLITFASAALLNMGTNFVFGKISFISDSVAVVLQLALAIDYAIILCHRFSNEHEILPSREACITALSKSIPEIAASSLTTISGLAALGFMQFGIGLDMAMVLIKSIFFSLISVFTLMPGLLMLFSPLIDKTRHKKLLPTISPVGRLAVKARYVLPPAFCLLLVGAIILSNQCPYTYTYTNIKTAKMTESQTAHFEIAETFGTANTIALLVPRGDYEAEEALLAELETRDEVDSVMGLANIEAMGGYKLTDALTPREFSELIDLDYEVAQVLYGAYAASGEELGQLVSEQNEYRVPLFDMCIFLKETLEENKLSVGGEDMASMTEMFSLLDTAQKQLQSENYSRMVVNLKLPEEGEETFAFLGEMRDIMGKYYDGDYYVVGNSTSSRDLAASFEGDNLLISLLSVFFVIIVLLFTFRSVGLPILLILVIQGSIWINFSFPTLMDQPLYFLGYLIVNAIQMGANIDYAIVISSHYQELKTKMSHKKAIVEAVNVAFPTVFTSGSMMAAAGLLIGNMSAQPVISIMGTCIGRGTIISIILVLFVLPSILVLGDSIIEKTRFRLGSPHQPEIEISGNMRVSGHIKGFVSGELDGDFTGTIKGEMNATLSTDTALTVEKEREGGEENA